VVGGWLLRLREHALPERVEEPVRIVSEAGQGRDEEPRHVVLRTETKAGAAEGIRDLFHREAAARHHRHERVRRREQLPHVCGRDRIEREATISRQSVEELEDAEHLRRRGEHLREERRAAAAGADDEAIHARAAVQ
jgi:hypothetical protein